MKFPPKGFTLIDVLVGSALVLIVFSGIFGAYRLSLKVIGQSKNKVTATYIANQQIELIKNLSYGSIGVKGSFPDGVLESSTTTVRNNIEYTIQNRVDYVVDSTDGISATSTPSDSCPLDYKRVKVKVSWSGLFGGAVSLSTDVAPKDLVQECATGGGILSVSVFDAGGIMVSFPLIEIKNPTTDETLKTATPSSGQYYFTLATSTYKVVVSKTGYSTERTYGTDEIATPEKPHPIVLNSQLIENSFSIDRVSAFSIDTLSPWGTDSFSDSFLNENNISEKSNVAVSGGEANLSKTNGVYFTGGTTDEDLCAFPGIEGDCGQSFTMGSQTKDISQIQLYLRKATSTPSDIYLEIRNTTTTGPVMTSSSQIVGANLPINFDWIIFSLQNSVTLNADTQYFLRLRSQPDSTDPLSGAKGPIHWGYASSSPSVYAGGNGFNYIGRNNNPFDSGQELNNIDFSFKIYDDEYVSSGYLISTAVSPAYLLQWNELSFTDSEPFNTDLKYQIYYATDTNWYLIPDSALPGNSIGFDSSPVDLSGLAVGAYPKLKLKANFSTGNIAATPVLYDWQVSWITSVSTPIPNVIFNLKGAKVIGTDAGEDPVYKHFSTSTSDSGGHKYLSNLEWDSYIFSSANLDLDLVGTDPSPQPVNLSPNSEVSVKLYLDAENSFLLTVQNSTTSGPVFAASARLYNVGLGYDTTQYTNEKGQTYFIPLETANYNLEIQATAYAATSTTVNVSGDVTRIIKLEQIE